MSTALYEVRTGDSRLPVKLLHRGSHLWLVEIVGQPGTKTWVMPSELVSVGSRPIEVCQ